MCLWARCLWHPRETHRLATYPATCRFDGLTQQGRGKAIRWMIRVATRVSVWLPSGGTPDMRRPRFNRGLNPRKAVGLSQPFTLPHQLVTCQLHLAITPLQLLPGTRGNGFNIVASLAQSKHLRSPLVPSRNSWPPQKGFLHWTWRVSVSVTRYPLQSITRTLCFSSSQAYLVRLSLVKTPLASSYLITLTGILCSPNSPSTT